MRIGKEQPTHDVGLLSKSASSDFTKPFLQAYLPYML